MHIQPPFQYDSLDKNNPRPSHPQVPKREWRALSIMVIAGIVTVIVFIIIIIIVHNKLDVISQTSYDWQRDIAILFKWLVYASPVAIMLLFIWHMHSLFGYVIKRINLVNLMEVQTTIDHLTKLGIGYNYLDVMLERAKQSKFSGVQTLTWDNSNNKEQQPEIELPLEEKDIEDYLPPANNPVIIELKNQGYINRSNNSILLGFEKDES